MPAPPDQGYTSITTARQTLGRYSFANIGHIGTSRTAPTANSSRVEFRLWDGSLEPGGIQEQVKMSTAMLDYTARNRDLVFPADERTPAGSLNPGRPEFAEDTRQIRGLIDELFRRDADKQQAAALWAAGLGARNLAHQRFVSAIEGLLTMMPTSVSIHAVPSRSVDYHRHGNSGQCNHAGKHQPTVWVG